jgi:hypothetical protein
MFSQQQQEQNAAALEMDMKREELMSAIQQYWKPVLGFAVFLVILTAGLQFYRWYDAKVAGEQMAQMLPLIEAPATTENAKALEDFAMQKASGRRQPMALLYAAAKYGTANQTADRVRVLGSVAEGDAPADLQDYARLLLANAGETAATGKIADKSVWQPAVKEVKALAEADTAKRRDAYMALADDATAPPALRKRAAEFAGTGQ